MLKKYFVEIMVWATLIAIVLTSVYCTFRIRMAINEVNYKIEEEGWQTATVCFESMETNESIIIIGYAKVREDVKENVGWKDPNIKGDGFFISICEK